MSDARSIGSVRKAYKYKLQPTPEQVRQLEETLWRRRTLYNAALEQRITLWKQWGVTLSRYEQEAELKELRAELPEYAAMHSHILQDVLSRLDRAYQVFFQRVRTRIVGKTGKKVGLPRFQGRFGNRYHTFTFKEYGNGVRLDNGFLVVSKIGRIALRWSRSLEGTPKTVTISREADGWYVIVSCAEAPVQPMSATGKETGIDVGLQLFLITADGLIVENPRHYRCGEKHLKKAQRRLSKRKKASKRRGKALVCLAKAQQKVRRQRADFHHMTALKLLRVYDVIYPEDLRVANLLRNRYLAKSISDAGWAQFRAILEAKAAYAGRRVAVVPAAYTSQDCSGILPDGSRCSERIEIALSVRTHICPRCGLILDRDENAARNIQWAGQALRGVVA